MNGANEPTERQALAEDLRRLVTSRLLDPLSILFESDIATDPMRRRVARDSEAWAALLLGPDRERAVHTAVRMIAVLYPGDAPFDPPEHWWRTPLGRVVARRLGHPAADRVPFAVAGAMLGITRQGVHDLVKRQKLAQHPDGGVTTASIRARLDTRAEASDDIRRSR
ncbi:hypothetical protein CLV63_13734 [Murinocardiopsis flavida]|uniref:MftR C-terminal domain-containing protein n=1 Tax=Murinocardiopsis flavida TaxID=645275 RepID=A0A2P8CLY2_9ACTN|nr:hypothetical protein [Murinocardiopsis flavida]PSK85975.1 hypothetical protein CLV63_13734 [Murinocardiopsis flavida]